MRMDLVRILKLLLIAGVLHVAPFPARAQQDELVRVYNEAQAAEATGNYALATQKYERIIELRPTMAEAHANLGNLYYVQGRAEQAQTSLKKALRLKPGLAAPHVLLGVILFNSHDYARATEYLVTARKLNASDRTAILYLGYSFYALGKHAESAELFEKSVALDPSNADAWYHLSKATGQLSKQYFELLQQKYSDAFETHLSRSHFYESAGNWAEAREQLSRALRQQSTNAQLEAKMKWLAQREGGDTSEPPAEATGSLAGSTRYLYAPPTGTSILTALDSERGAIRQALNVKPSNAQSLYHLAEGYQAQSFLAALWVLQADPDSYRAHQLTAQSYEAAGRLEEAVKAYREVLSRKPDLQTVHFAIGNLYWRNVRMEEALPELEAELKINPQDAQALYEVGDIFLSQGNTAEAEKIFEEAVRYAPNMEDAHLALERIASSKEDYAKALSHLKRAADISPRNPTPHYRMWILYRRLGRTAEAQGARAKFEALKRQTSTPIEN